VLLVQEVALGARHEELAPVRVLAYKHKVHFVKKL
jgi:hypothetical protein